MAGQGHGGEQRSYFACAAFIHLPGVVQAGFDQLVANGLSHLGHHIAMME
jgi:hypothetical protein